MRTLLILLAGAPLFAGQAVVLSTQSVSNNMVAAQAANGPCRLEASAQDWNTNWNPSSTLVDATACGMLIKTLNIGSASWISITDSRGVGVSDTNLSLANLPAVFVTMRIQRIPNGAGGIFSVELIDSTGAVYNSTQQAYASTSGSNGNGLTVTGTGSGQNVSHNYTRLFPNTVAVGSRVPVTADDGTIVEWKYDSVNNTGTLADFNGVYNGTISSGMAAYDNTDFQSLVLSVPTTCNAPSWSTWISMRVGYTNCLSGAGSYSQADASASVTNTWTNVSGPTTPVITSPAGATTNLTNFAFGSYIFNLHVIDAAMNTADTQITVGAVSYNDSGVVQHSDPNVAKFFGDQIAFGQNPWGYADERNLYATLAQIANNTYYSSQAALWSVPATGTIAYSFTGVGPPPGSTGATLNGGITATATSIAIHNSQAITGLANLPTWIFIGNAIGAQEVIRITATTAITGDATLTVGYDGRGLAGAVALNAQPVLPAQIWANGTTVGEMRIQGTSTLFATDSQRPICQAGVPGPPGLVAYSTGTVVLTAGDTTIPLTGGTWSVGNGVVVGGYIRVPATHSATPFTYWAKIVSFTSSSMVVDRAPPTGVDATSFAYKITGIQYWSLGFTVSGIDTQALQQGIGCESETAAFAIVSHDIPAMYGVVPSGKRISYKTVFGSTSANGPNFYGTGLMHRMFYYRSGYGPSLTAANLIDDYWTRDPENCNGYCSGSPLLSGGGYIGGIADVVLNSSALMGYVDLKHLGEIATTYAAGNCNDLDPRDQGYPHGQLATLALFDTDPTRHAAWISGLSVWVTRDKTCRRNAADGYVGVQVNSWAGSSQWSDGGPAMTLTNGSTAATPTVAGTFTAGQCAGVDNGTGTITVTNGSTAATVITGSAASNFRITITDTISSPLYVGAFQFSASGANVTLAGAWPGASGTFKFMVEGSSLYGFMSSIGTSKADWPDVSVATGLANNLMLQKFWACKFNNADSITLNRPWDGTNGTNYHISSYVTMGFEVQPFMLGIKTAALNWASQVDDPTVAADNVTLAQHAGTWLSTYGVDINTIGTLGTYYARVQENCEPGGVPNAVDLFFSIHGNAFNQIGCGAMGLAEATGGEFPSRVNTAEGGNGLMTWYQALPNSTRKDFVNKYYGAIFGYCPFATGTSLSYCDGHYVNPAGELSNTNLGSFKWSGFFFGIGGLFNNGWPALSANETATSVDRRYPSASRAGSGVRR